MRQETTLYEDCGPSSGGHESQADMAELSSYLACMAIIVGLIITWVACFVS